MNAAEECLVCGVAEPQQYEENNASLLPVLAGLLGQDLEPAHMSSCSLCQRCHHILSEAGSLQQRLGQLKEAILSVYRPVKYDGITQVPLDNHNGSCSLPLSSQLPVSDPATSTASNHPTQHSMTVEATLSSTHSSHEGVTELARSGSSSSNTSTMTSNQPSMALSGRQDIPAKKSGKPASTARRLPCPICGKSVTARYLRDHQRQHSGERPFPCTLCSRSFAKSSDLSTHLRRHAGDRRHRCSLCPAAFFFPHELANHRHTHGDTRPHLCAKCGTGFLSRAGLLRHQRANHPESRAGDTSDGASVPREPRYKCAVCEKTFTCEQSLKRHERAHGAGKSYMCELCGVTYKTSTALRFHTRRHHSGERPFQCQVCGCQFITRSVWLRHLRVHTGEMPFRCQFCGTDYKDKQKLKRHYSNKHAADVERVGVENLKYSAAEVAPVTATGGGGVDRASEGQGVSSGASGDTQQSLGAIVERNAEGSASGQSASDFDQGGVQIEVGGSIWTSEQWKEAESVGQEYSDTSATVADPGTVSELQAQEMSAVEMMPDSSVLTQGMLYEAHTALFNYF
ncbi:zinc finger protein 668-like [Amphibalanus amphitrite]|uniref:zinc finger protein 668-like n=1 Tax=Amphibalanus amphitrite TaxID=1232801 RepID=UPI001C914682|nr:zinc finger protein 668-like [Amphibalanus amphitrite]XP_043195267.1 zinc finger protein 668-like [Amphibalanus amphitrite]XP_043195268.1 zinc finger protein 668-like [Amphibalanus amphitrite]